MHPELLNNSLFLKYYKQWQDDPSSIVFAPISEYFLMYDMPDAALKVCREGLKRHPNLVSGRIVMARIHIKRGNWEEAESELNRVLSVVPENQMAKRLMREVDLLRSEERADVQAHAPAASPPAPSDAGVRYKSWNTVTMASIFASQGHYDRAREIYNSILAHDPGNEAAQRGMAELQSR
ncbi:MAG: tetratricopeptide repeat protein [bacterium]